MRRGREAREGRAAIGGECSLGSNVAAAMSRMTVGGVAINKGGDSKQ